MSSQERREETIPIISSSYDGNGHDNTESELLYGTSCMFESSAVAAMAPSTTSSTFLKGSPENVSHYNHQQDQSSLLIKDKIISNASTFSTAATVYSVTSSSELSNSQSESSDLICTAKDEEHDTYYEELEQQKNHEDAIINNKENSTGSFYNALYNNRKLFISSCLWFISYELMGIIGGTIAFLHFPRTPSQNPAALPDYGYDLIPYFCPYIPYVPHGNVQSVILLIFYVIIVCGVFQRWNKKYHYTLSSFGVRRGDAFTMKGTNEGRWILQQLLHLNVLVFITRTTTVFVTALPQPNPRCVAVQHSVVNYADAFAFVMGRGFPPHACGDLIYSGHVGCTLVSFLIMRRHQYLTTWWKKLVIGLCMIMGILSTLSCRSHYTVDVVLASYFVKFIHDYYFLRSEDVVEGGYIGRFIRWLERSDFTLDAKNDNVSGCDDDSEIIKEERLVTRIE